MTRKPLKKNSVLFRSDLFHESGPVKFRSGYENHRINITLLFGEQSGEKIFTPETVA